MSAITLSPGVRQNLLSLQNTADLLNVTQNRLATGKKVNSAFDNPVSFFASQSLSNRASDLSSLLDQIGQAQQTLNAANQGLTSLTSLVAVCAVDRQAGAVGGRTRPRPGYRQPGRRHDGSAPRAPATSSSPLPAAPLIPSRSPPPTPPHRSFRTSTRFRASAPAGAITATTDSTGHLQLAANPTSSFTITADATTAAVGLTIDASTNFTAPLDANTSRNTLQGNYNSLLTQIDQLAGDSSYNGVNLLNGNNLKVVFNESNTSSADDRRRDLQLGRPRSHPAQR